MTVKELLTNISFDELLPILKKYATDHIHDIYIFREVYDILKNIVSEEDILTKEYNEDDAKKNTIEKYLSNYQIGNKNLIYGSVDEDQWKKLSDDKKSKFNEERKNRRKSINKKIENVIEKIVEDIIEKEDEYRKLLRVNIIKINKKERR